MLFDKRIPSIFYDAFPDASTPVLVKAPGRVNIIGEHTDYNEGFVLPAAIDKAVYMAVASRADREINLYAHDLNQKYSISLQDLSPVEDQSWPNYILGSIAQVDKRFPLTSGFDIALTSDIPIGAGLSSSAAVESATVFALNQLLNLSIDRISMVKMAQAAEHEYAKVNCGIMDQFASVMGKRNHVIKLDCRNLSYEYLPLKLDGVKIVLLNTNVKHSLVSSEYNTRRQECKQAVEWVQEFEPSVQSLRDVSESMLDKYVRHRSTMIDMRSRFVVQEIKRLESAALNLQYGDLPALGRKMFETHQGLSTMYEVSCKELDWLVDFVKGRPGVLGARMMGGGFGGCTINLVRESEIDQLLDAIEPAYEASNDLTLSYYITSIEDGVDILSSKIFQHV